MRHQSSWPCGRCVPCASWPFDHFLTFNPCVTGGELCAAIVTRYESDMIRAAQSEVFDLQMQNGISKSVLFARALGQKQILSRALEHVQSRDGGQPRIQFLVH